MSIGALVSSALAPNRHLQAAKLRSPKRGDHVLGAIARHVDKREGVVDLDRADRPRFQPRLASNRADEIAGTNPGAPSGADKDPHHVFIARTTLLTRHSA